MTQPPAAWRPLARSIRWPPLIGMAALASVTIMQGRLANVPDWQYETRLRIATALIAGGAALVLDDVAARTLEATSRYRRIGVTARVTAIAAVAAAGWMVCLLVIPIAPTASHVGASALEAASWLAWMCVVARSVGTSAVMASALVMLIVIAHLPDRWTLTGPTTPGWTTTEMRWSAIGIAGALTLFATLRDPAARAATTRSRAVRR